MELTVELRKGGLEAVARLASGPFDLEEGTRLTLERLNELGAANGVRPEAVRRALAAFAGGHPPEDGVVVARGEAPQQGINAQLLPLFPVHDTPPANGSDPLAAYARNVVYAGQPVLKKTPASPGIPGRSLLGTPLSAPDGTDIPIFAGEGLEAVDDGLTFTATAYGVVLFHRGQLQVWDALRVTEDRMEARLTVLPDPRCDEADQVAKLAESLERMEVCRGLDLEALTEAVRTARAEGRPAPDVVVARGQLPVDGREADYRLLVDSERKVGKLLEGDRIDFREAETVKNVRRGDPLAEIIPGIEAVAGFRVDGSPLRPSTQRAQGLKPGQNTVPSADGLQILADGDGMLILKGGRFHVADEYLVQGDVDYRTGNIRATGAVLIRGQVKAGFQVQGEKSVEILQDVEEAVVEAKGEVTVRGGVTAGSRVAGGRNVTAKYIQNSRVEAEGDVEVKLSVTNSQVYAKGRVRAVGSQGAILGGEVNAAMGIEARTVGSPTSKTHVAVGVDLRVLRDIETIDKERSGLLEELKSIQSSLGRNFLQDPRSSLAAIPPPLRKGKLEMLQRMKTLYQRDTDLKAQRDMLNEINRELMSAQIAVQGEIHAGTLVTVSVARLTLPETLRHVLLYYDPAGNRVAWRRL